jgi:hypothetical protein
MSYKFKVSVASGYAASRKELVAIRSFDLVGRRRFLDATSNLKRMRRRVVEVRGSERSTMSNLH